MTASRPDDDRNVIPRWRDPTSTMRQGELGPIRRRKEDDGYATDFTALRHLEDAWHVHGTLAFAADLVGSALVVGVSPAARDAAKFVLSQEAASPLAASVARRVLGIPDDETAEPGLEAGTIELRDEIRELKDRILRDPRNTLVWTELARHYTINGHSSQAAHSMRIALALSPEHRYVLRSASRLAIHDGEFDRAHSVITRASPTRSDPWLVATELATAEVAGRRPWLVKHGERMLGSGQFLPIATTELASALGTLELRSGSNRTARRLFAASLETANENSIAQSEWASHRIQGVQIPHEQLEESAEALAQAHSEGGRWQASVEAAWRWLRDQPFSSRPALLGSYEASLGQDFAAGVRFARAGLRANPAEFLLRNNLVFCLINAGDLAQAKEEFEKIGFEQLASEEKGTYLATSGLLAFREGDPERGEREYVQAIESLAPGRSRTIAAILLAGELFRSRLPGAEPALEQAQALGKDTSHPDIRLWLNYLPTETLRIPG